MPRFNQKPDRSSVDHIEASPKGLLRLLTFTLAVVVSFSILSSCGTINPSDQTGVDPQGKIPDEIQALLPSDAVICFEESVTMPVGYQLWIVRAKAGQFLEVPAHLHEQKGHELPAEVLIRLIRNKVPGLDVGQPKSAGCRFTHWRKGGAEYQLRELTSSNGWFASIELISG